MRPFTVIGFWNDADEAIPVGIVEGEHVVGGGSDVSEGGPWAITVQAEDMDDAEKRAVEEMQKGDEDD